MGAEHVRISNAAKELIQKFGAWFTHFPTFSYIRIDGCLRAPYKLPRYPTYHIIILWVTRKICAFDAILKKDIQKSGFGNEFPLRIGVHEAFPYLATT